MREHSRKRRMAEFFAARDIRVWAMLTIAICAVFGFLMIGHEILESSRGETEAMVLFDGKVLEFFASHRSPLLTGIMLDLTSLGSITVVLVLSLIVGSLLYSWKDHLGVMHLLVVLAGAGLWPTILKLFFHRPRPSVVEHLVLVHDLSFPSGHSLGAASVYLTLAFFASRHRRQLGFEFFFLGLACLIIALVATSRMYLGVHYPSDVAAGICAGAAWSLIVATIFHPFYVKAATKSPLPSR